MKRDVVLAVWNGQPGDGPGGTADAVQLWRDEGYEPDADLRDFDTRLVGFGTRNVFATISDPKRGAIAARDFIAAQFRSIAQSSGGRMTVALATYQQAKTDEKFAPAVDVVNTLRIDSQGSNVLLRGTVSLEVIGKLMKNIPQ